MAIERDAGERMVAAWRTKIRATTYLIENLPRAVWGMAVPGVPRQTVGMLAAHFTTAGCGWIKALGASHRIRAPRLVDLRRVGQKELVQALARSSDGLIRLIELGVARGRPRAAWRPGAFPWTSEHFLTYSRPTRAITAARSAWWCDSSGIVCPRPSPAGCGNGRNGPGNRGQGSAAVRRGPAFSRFDRRATQRALSLPLHAVTHVVY